jgi:hypothetical protein
MSFFVAKYDALREYLEQLPPGPVTLSFQAIDEMVPGGLPEGAFQHRAWWANEIGGHHVQARAWLQAGRTVVDASPRAGRVRFSARSQATHPSVTDA